MLATMKKIWTILMIMACLKGYAQEGDLPGAVKSAFENKYQDVRIESWWVENQLFYMDFNFQGGSYTTVFDEQGSWKETAETISEFMIPGELREYIRSNFPSGSICFCEKVETPDKQQYLRVTLIDQGNVDRILRSDMEGKNIVLQNPDTT